VDLVPQFFESHPSPPCAFFWFSVLDQVNFGVIDFIIHDAANIVVVEFDELAIQRMDMAKSARLLDKASLFFQFSGGAVFPCFSVFQPSAWQAKQSAVLPLPQQNFVLTRIRQEDSHAYTRNPNLRL